MWSFAGIAREPTHRKERFILIPNTVLCVRSGTAGEFPLRLRRQTVLAICAPGGRLGYSCQCFERRRSIEFVAKLERIRPTHHFHREFTGVEIYDDVLASAVSGKLRWIMSHH